MQGSSLAHLFAVEPENDWRLKAACKGLDPELFFSTDAFEAKQDKDAREAEAKAVCASCAVREECLDYAIKAGERYGIWGGLTETERRIMRSHPVTASHSSRSSRPTSSTSCPKGCPPAAADSRAWRIC